MYSLWWPNHIVLAHVSKVAKNLCVVCEKHCKIALVSICYDDLKYEKITLTHTQS